MSERPREILLEDRLAVLAGIADDCVMLVADGEPISDEIWPHMRRIALCAENDLSVWRRLPYYRRARTHIRAAISDCLNQLEMPR